MFSRKLVRDLFFSTQPLHRHFLATHQRVLTTRNKNSEYLFSDGRHHIHYTAASTFEEQTDPFSLVSDDVSRLAAKMRSVVSAEFPKLASGAEYFFKMGVEGKHFRPTALLLMATAFNSKASNLASDKLSHATEAYSLVPDLPTRLQLIAEITELIHVGSLLHGDVTDENETGRNAGSFNMLFGNKLAVLVGDFLLSRAYVALASLENTEVLSLLGKVVEHHSTGETMEMTMTGGDSLNMQYYLEKIYYKRSSLISSSCKAIALLAGQTTEVANLAYEYGNNLGLAHQLTKDVLDFTGSSTLSKKCSASNIRNGIITAPLLFAIDEFPQLCEVVKRGFHNPADVDLALDCLSRSEGIQKSKDLAAKYASLAAEAIDSLPRCENEDIGRSRRALLDLTDIVINRSK